MTPSELKLQLERRGTETHFFSRRNMAFSGDTMRNYGVRSAVIKTNSGEENVECWEVYRRHPVKHGLSSSAFFRKDDYTQTFEARQ